MRVESAILGPTAWIHVLFGHAAHSVKIWQQCSPAFHPPIVLCSCADTTNCLPFECNTSIAA